MKTERAVMIGSDRRDRPKAAADTMLAQHRN
jgi:hypothetical protein